MEQSIQEVWWSLKHFEKILVFKKRSIARESGVTDTMHLLHSYYRSIQKQCCVQKYNARQHIWCLGPRRFPRSQLSEDNQLSKCPFLIQLKVCSSYPSSGYHFKTNCSTSSSCSGASILMTSYSRALDGLFQSLRTNTNQYTRTRYRILNSFLPSQHVFIKSARLNSLPRL